MELACRLEVFSVYRALSVLAVLLGLTAGNCETLMVLDDAEGAVGPWRGAQMVSEPVHGGKGAMKWEVGVRNSLDSPALLADWTAFDELRFWAYLPEPVDFKIPIVFPAEGGYYIIDWKLDWEGWKEHRIRLADCRPAHQPAGWDQIRGIGFRAQGYGQPAVPEGLTVVFDDFALHSPEDLPVSTMADWVAKERREAMARLKSRGNPYYHSVLDGLKNAKAEPALPTEIKSSWAFSGLTSTALAMAWAAAWDQSPRRGDETLIAHATALIDFCLQEQKDGSWYYSRRWEQTADPNSDRFALGPLMDAVWWLKKLPAGQASWERWKAPVLDMVQFQYTRWGCYEELGYQNNEAWGSSAGRYPNQDVFHLVEMALAHEFYGDDKYLTSAHKTLAALQAHLLPDGGLNYIGPETEIPCYHDLNVLWIARYYTLTGDERARDLLAATVSYYPLTYSNEGRPEYYTDCWWKHYWSDGAACGPEIIAGITGDGHNKWLADRLLERQGTGGQYRAIYAGMLYREDVVPRELPDNWLRHDGNIGGPRGRFGGWYFAGVTGGGARDTFVGGMVCRPQTAEPLDGALLAANIEVGTADEGIRDRTNLYISGPDDLTSTSIDGDAAALGALYSPRKPYINGTADPQVPRTDWEAVQVWLLSRHGLVGLVKLEATAEQTVAYLGGEIRMGPRWSISEEEGAFRCGSVVARVLESSFPLLEVGPARPGYAQQSTQHWAITLRTPAGPYTARPGEPVYYLAAIGPKDAPTATEAERIEASGVAGLAATVEGVRYAVLFGTQQTEARATLRWPTAQARMAVDGEEPRTVAAQDGGIELTVPAGKVVLLTGTM